jgi:hypothetical protein
MTGEPEFRNWLTISKRWLRSADILVCEFGRLSSRPDAGLESPAGQQAGKLALHCSLVIAVFNFGIQDETSSVAAGLEGAGLNEADRAIS